MRTFAAAVTTSFGSSTNRPGHNTRGIRGFGRRSRHRSGRNRGDTTFLVRHDRPAVGRGRAEHKWTGSLLAPRSVFAETPLQHMRRIFVGRATVSPDPREMPTPHPTLDRPPVSRARRPAAARFLPPDICRPCYRFTGPREMPTHTPPWTGPRPRPLAREETAKNIRLSSAAANLLSRSQNCRADGDGCAGLPC
jgi:hypothetical protein